MQNGLDKTCGKTLQRLAEKWDDPSKVDALAGVQAQVNKTKQTMQTNIQTVLANTEKMENIDEKTNELSQQAQVFRDSGKRLRQAMWWKKCKWQLMLTFIVLVVLALIGVGIYLATKKGKEKYDGNYGYPRRFPALD